MQNSSMAHTNDLPPGISAVKISQKGIGNAKANARLRSILMGPESGKSRDRVCNRFAIVAMCFANGGKVQVIELANKASTFIRVPVLPDGQ